MASHAPMNRVPSTVYQSCTVSFEIQESSVPTIVGRHVRCHPSVTGEFVPAFHREPELDAEASRFPGPSDETRASSTHLPHRHPRRISSLHFRRFTLIVPIDMFHARQLLRQNSHVVVRALVVAAGTGTVTLMWNLTSPSPQRESFRISPQLALCDAKRSKRFDTLRRIEQQSTKQPMESNYDVDWD